jgi:hypothetical protein
MGVGDINLIAKIAPYNDGFQGMVDADQVIVDAAAFSGNLSPTDTDLQLALATLDAMSAGASSLQLDQTTPQNVINGAPQFDEGITIKKDKFIYLDGD